MKLEVGKYYKTRDGETVGPLERSTWGDFTFRSRGRTWLGDGDYYSDGTESSRDLIQEVNPDGSSIKTEPEDKTWGEMTPEEQGALLLAHHNGETIEYRGNPCWARSYWFPTKEPQWVDTYAYRVKPEPKVTTDIVYWGENLRTTHKITFSTIDGEPDVSTVKMEKL